MRGSYGRLWFVGGIVIAVASAGCVSRPGVVVMTPSAARAVSAPSLASGRIAVARVWVRQPNGESVTYRVDDEGEIVDRQDGTRILARGMEWTWLVGGVDVPTVSCAHATGVRAPSRPAQALRASLLRSNGTAANGTAPNDGDARQERSGDRAASEQPVLDPDLSCETGLGCANDLHHEVELIGSAGPYLFVVERRSTDTCGVHALATSRFLVWDAQQGRPVDWLGGLPDRDALVARARGDLVEPSPLSGTGTSGAGMGITGTWAAGTGVGTAGMAIVGLRPLVRGDRLVFEAQVTADTCFACSDGAWSSYTRSTFVEAAAPRGIETGSVFPPAVLAFRRRHPELVPLDPRRDPWPERRTAIRRTDRTSISGASGGPTEGGVGCIARRDTEPRSPEPEPRPRCAEDGPVAWGWSTHSERRAFGNDGLDGERKRSPARSPE